MVFIQIDSVDFDDAFVVCKPRYRLYRRRLAGTVRSQKADHFAGTDFEGNAVDGFYRTATAFVVLFKSRHL